MSSVPVFRKVQWPIACQHTCTLSETYLNRAVYKERLEVGTCNLGVITLVEAREVEYRLLAHDLGMVLYVKLHICTNGYQLKKS